MQTIIIQKNEAGQRLDKFLKKYLPGASTSFCYKMLRKKNITKNRQKCEGNEILQVGDSIETFFSEETYQKMRQASGSTAVDRNDTAAELKAYQLLHAIKVVYEDEEILLCNKPAGVLSQKSAPDDISANEWLLGYLLHKGHITAQSLQLFRPSVCNRLDRNTSGLLICSKSLRGAQICSSLLKERSLHKYYYALVKGRIDHDFSARGYLKKDETTNKVSLSLNETAGADYIETGFHPLTYNSQYTLLEVLLITGKTHQIRAHLSSLGHPIIGDPKYGDRKCNQIFLQKYHLKQQLLHAARLVFPSAKDLPPEMQYLADQEFTAPLPDIFQEIVKDANLEI